MVLRVYVTLSITTNVIGLSWKRMFPILTDNFMIAYCTPFYLILSVSLKRPFHSYDKDSDKVLLVIFRIMLILDNIIDTGDTGDTADAVMLIVLSRTRNQKE